MLPLCCSASQPPTAAVHGPSLPRVIAQHPHLFSLYMRAASELAGELGFGSDSKLCSQQAQSIGEHLPKLFIL